MITITTIIVIYLACGVQFADAVERHASEDRRGIVKGRVWLGLAAAWLPILIIALLNWYWPKVDES